MDIETLPAHFSIDHQIKILGKSPIVIIDEFDEDQHWLDFMDGQIFAVRRKRSTPAMAPEYERATLARKLKKLVAKPFATVQDSQRTMFSFKDGKQLFFRFEEHRRINFQQLARIKRNDYPGWDRTPSGEICTVDFPKGQRGSVASWCAEQCSGLYHVAEKIAYFENIDDAVAAKLTFYSVRTP